MATLCKNCAAPLVFDPATQRVVCRSCGSSWTAEEVESTDKAFVSDKQPVSAEEVYGKDDDEIHGFDEVRKDYMDCYIYTCSSCGGEVAINGTDISTKCIYCGNTTVVFNRIAKEKSPEFIIPFQITKEQAVDLIRKRFARGWLIPRSIRNFNPEQVHGIYLPYWLVNARLAEAGVFSSRVKKDENSYETLYWGRSGELMVRNPPVDGARMLSTKSIQCLEPFDYSQLKSFDEDYLLGFYSNSSSINNEQLEHAVSHRCHEAYDEAAKDTFGGSEKRLYTNRQLLLIDRDLRYTMIPVWFVTYKHNGFQSTVLVNGQTGKVVCGAPWNEKAFYALTILTAIVLTAIISVVLAKFVLPAVYPPEVPANSYPKYGSSDRDSTTISILVSLLLFIFGFMIEFGIRRFRRAVKQLKLSQSASMFNFLRKKEG